MTAIISLFIKDLRKYPFLSLISILAGICLGSLIYFFHLQLPLLSKRNILIAMLLTIATATLFFFLLRKTFSPNFENHKRSIRLFIIAIALILSVLLNAALEFTAPHFYLFYPEHNLTVSMDMRQMDAQEFEGISFSHLKLAYRDVSYSELNIDGQYDIRDDAIFFPSGQMASFTWQGITGEETEIYFQTTSQPVYVDIQWDDTSQKVDLSEAQSTHTKVEQEFSPPAYENLLIRILLFPIIFIILLLLINGLFSPAPYTSIMLLGWLLVYLIYWPGIIGSVSIEAVEELLSGHPANWHPIFYTLLLTFATKFLASASAFLVLQILSLALIFGAIFKDLEHRGIRKSVLVILSIITTVLPTNFLPIITLTNDIPYSIVLLAISFMAFKIVISKGAWIEKPLHRILLGIAAALAILFRYNGIPAIFLFFLTFIILYPKKWIQIITILALAVALVFVVNGPLSNALNVTNETEGHLDNIFLHHISAHVANGTYLTEEESSYLDTLLPIEDWRYSCCDNSAMWGNTGFDREAFHANSSYNRSLALALFLRNPKLELQHMICASDLVWNIVDGCAIKHSSVAIKEDNYYWTRSHYPDYLENSLLPNLVPPLSRAISFLNTNPAISTLLWRPAWFFYLAIIGSLVFIKRIGSIRGALPISPALGQSLFLLLFNRVQNFRYQYCIVPIGIFIFALIFYKPQSD